jgi:ADP-ribosyl-[dinitrogen reductase] hydrolase
VFVDERLDRARGCFYGQLIGDALGSLVEFQSPERIAMQYPDGVRELHDGGTWNTIAGQPTDDSEMALVLARAIIADGKYDQNTARSVYVDWLESEPFDVGNTIHSGLRGVVNFDSQANGALMRVSPLAIYAAGIGTELAARHAREDAWITHPHEVTQDANVLFVLTIAEAISTELDSLATYSVAKEITREHGLANPVAQALTRAEHSPPESFTSHQGWVLIALQNAFYQLCHAESFEHAMVDTIGRGGDTDTNAAICGALLGAVYGLRNIPDRWVRVIEECTPESGLNGVHQPRPREFWPVDAAELADNLLFAGTTHAQ